MQDRILGPIHGENQVSTSPEAESSAAPGRRRKVTSADVARLAGVSRTTVSDILNGQRIDETVLKRAGDAAADEAELVADVRGSVPYKRELMRVYVGRAVAAALHPLDCELTWIDDRNGQFPDDRPTDVKILALAMPELAVDEAPPSSATVPSKSRLDRRRPSAVV